MPVRVALQELTTTYGTCRDRVPAHLRGVSRLGVCEHTWSTGHPPPRSMAVQGGEGAGLFWPPIIRLVTITVPFMGTLPADTAVSVSTRPETSLLQAATT